MVVVMVQARARLVKMPYYGNNEFKKIYSTGTHFASSVSTVGKDSIDLRVESTEVDGGSQGHQEVGAESGRDIGTRLGVLPTSNRCIEHKTIFVDYLFGFIHVGGKGSGSCEFTLVRTCTVGTNLPHELLQNTEKGNSGQLEKRISTRWRFTRA